MLKLIHGGDGGDKNTSETIDEGITRYKRLRQLALIERDAELARRLRSGPRAQRAFSFGMLTCGGIYACLLLSDRAHFFEQPIHWDTIRLFFPILFGFGVFYLVLKHSSLPRSWMERVDERLFRYSPVDKEAFRQLQAETRQLGHLEPFLVREWVWQERRAIDTVLLGQAGKKSSFLNKKV